MSFRPRGEIYVLVPTFCVNAIKLRATTRDCPYLQCRFCRGNPLWLPRHDMALTFCVGMPARTLRVLQVYL
ncbi:hypothetical protein THIOM_002841 [Candidatus Thiomargarita nelsonii]|uniref:Uncharacterized protein n=1 Tax=Candidatus Thiomargarita nelsonii TaxID=1003181 RepID=A0A176S0A9_9GAMM|nr:hypothetical protein THIOM_002841 [Candidatus Thiomargarita nelsonii]